MHSYIDTHIYIYIYIYTYTISYRCIQITQPYMGKAHMSMMPCFTLNVFKCCWATSSK